MEGIQEDQLETVPFTRAEPRTSLRAAKPLLPYLYGDKDLSSGDNRHEKAENRELLSIISALGNSEAKHLLALLRNKTYPADGRV